MRKYLIFPFLFFLTIWLNAQPEIPPLKQWATDLTKTLVPSELSALNNRLKAFEDTTSNQIVFLMIPSLEDYPIEMLAYEISTTNRIGTGKNDNGVLLLVAKKDRKIRIEVGYGLEGVLPDALCSSIIRNVIVPEFKKDEYYSGVNNGIDAIISAIGGEYVSAKDEDTDNPIPTIIFIIIFIFIFFTFSRFRSTPGGVVYRTGRSGGWGSSGSWSGGSGSFGGFSSGGGSFGGGGASGSW